MDDNWKLQSLIKGIKKEHGTRVNQKLPITPQILLDIRRKIDLSVPFWISFWSACLVAFYGFLRKSNIFYDSSLPPKSQKHLCRGDFIWHQDNLIIRIRQSKTIQFRERYLDLPLPSKPEHPLCPVTAVVKLLLTVH